MRRAQTPEHLARTALIDSLEVGDLIRLNSKLRVVRDIGRSRKGRITCLVFAISRCSWTRRPFTVYVRTDLYNARLELVKKGYGLGDDFLSAKLQETIADHSIKDIECCDVIGVLD